MPDKSKNTKHYETTVELVNRESDRNHWNYSAWKPYLKTKEFKRIKQNVRYYPKDLDNVTLKCDCGHHFTPNWLEKQPFPILPLVNKQGGVYAMSECNVLCPRCRQPVVMSLSFKQWTSGEIEIFGDEAFRHDLKKYDIYSYSCVSKIPNEDIKNEFERKFLDLKSKLITGIKPRSWILHFSEMWRGTRKGIYKNLTMPDIFKFCEELAELIAAYDNKYLTIWNCSSVYFKSEDKKHHVIKKENTYYPLLMRVISEMTESGISPHFKFESTNNDGWAKNLFLGGRCTLIWPYISKGIPIPNPEFIPKQANPFLEIADFASFVIARYLYLIGKENEEGGQTLDVDPSWLGNVRYIGFDNNGIANLVTNNSYPIKTFFSNTEWEAAEKRITTAIRWSL